MLLVEGLACLLMMRPSAVDGKILEDGACPVFALLPFTSRYVATYHWSHRADGH